MGNHCVSGMRGYVHLAPRSKLTTSIPTYCERRECYTGLGKLLVDKHRFVYKIRGVDLQIAKPCGGRNPIRWVLLILRGIQSRQIVVLEFVPPAPSVTLTSTPMKVPSRKSPASKEVMVHEVVSNLIISNQIRPELIDAKHSAMEGNRRKLYSVISTYSTLVKACVCFEALQRIDFG